MWNIYDYKGVLKATAHKVEYNGAEGAVSTVSTTITSPTPINWKVSDLIEYRGEMFTLRHIPQAKKQASNYSSGEAYVYNDVTFYSHIDELASCDFLDVVKEDNNIHYSALPNFDFYCETIYDIADRLQANLDRLYTGDKKWTIVVETDPTAKTSITPQSLSFSAEKCSDVLERIVNKLKVNYTYKGRTITLGGKPITIAYNFEYGKGKGLTSIEQSGADGNAIVTRVRAYGSSENMPHRYYNKLWKNTKTGAVAYFKTTPDDYFNDEEQAKLWVKHISETMYVPNLMLPAFRESGKDAYIDNEDAIAKYGLREGTVFFDGNGENEKVCPTIKNMTAERLQNAGINVSLIEGDNGNLDEIYSADAIEDNGMLPDDGSSLPVDKSYFNIYLKDLGFDINDYLVGGQTPVISMQSGTCAGREFEIAECKKQTILGATIYVLNCQRQVDNGIYLAFPNSNYQIKSGDKFSLSSIELPEAYVLAASEKLEELAIEWLEKNSQPNFTFSPEIDALNALRNPEVANALKEGKEMFLYDDDLGINKIMKITNLKIVEGESLAPKYEVTLSDKVQLSLEKRVTQSVVESIPTSGVASSNILSIAQAYGDKYFLNKRKADTASQTIKFQLGLSTGEYIQGNQGAKIDGNGNAEMQSLAIRDKMVTTNFIQGSLVGVGGGFYTLDGKTYAEFDYLTARKGATFAELVIQEYNSVGGALVVSQAHGEIADIHKWSNGSGYDIYLKEWNSNNQFQVGDFVRCQYWDRTTNHLTSYWVRVTDTPTTANGTKVLNFVATDFPEGVEPKVGDRLVQMGNASNTERQGCILITTENSMPRIAIIDGINKKQIEQSNYKCVYGSLEGFTDHKGNSLSGYGLWGENAYLHGEMVLSSTNTSVSDALTSVSDALTRTKALIDEEIAEINNRLDGVVVNWFGDDVPRLDNHPAEQWTTDAERANHIGDTYTNTETEGDNAGRSWRFVQDNGEYKWILIADSDAVKALELASKAQVTADGKRRVFTSTPYVPYDKGDLWVKQEGEKTTLYYAIADKKETDIYSESDWLIGATDDTTINDLQIGGRNLLVGTNQGVNNWFLGTSLDKTSSYFITDSYYNGANGVRFEKLVADKADWETFQFPLRSQMIKKGQTYHLSFDLMADGIINNLYSLGFRIVEGNGDNALSSPIYIDNVADDGIWKHYDLEFVANASGNASGKQVVYFYNRNLPLAWTSFNFANLKLEEGNKATAWSPAPEDVDNSLTLLKTETTAEIKKLDDSIKLSVEKTKEYADGKIETLQGYVDTKADEVKLGVKNDLATTGIDITTGNITATADRFEIRNQRGNTTAKINANGLIEGRSGFATIFPISGESTNPNDVLPAQYINKLDDKLTFYHITGKKALEIGIDSSTDSIIRMYDENGNLTWRLGTEARFLTNEVTITYSPLTLIKYDNFAEIPEPSADQNLTEGAFTYYKEQSELATNGIIRNEASQTATQILDGIYALAGYPTIVRVPDGNGGFELKYRRTYYVIGNGRILSTSFKGYVEKAD